MRLSSLLERELQLDPLANHYGMLKPPNWAVKYWKV